MSEQARKEEFLALVGRVREINPEAADWLENGDKPDACDFEHSGDITAVMIWDETPQGGDFWCDIDERLDDLPVSDYDPIKQQRDELLAALNKFIEAGFGNSTDFSLQMEAYRMGIDAIAKATS